MRPTDYCLTCGGTGRRGNLSGKKKCRTCHGTGGRSVEPTKNGEPVLLTTCDFVCVTVPAIAGGWPTLDLRAGSLLSPEGLEGIDFHLEKLYHGDWPEPPESDQ